jgi:hypothetical protein
MGVFRWYRRAFEEAFLAISWLEDALLHLVDEIRGNAYSELRRVVSDLQKEYQETVDRLRRKKYLFGSKKGKIPVAEGVPAFVVCIGYWLRLRLLADRALEGRPRLMAFYELGKAIRQAQVSSYEGGVKTLPDLGSVVEAIRPLEGGLSTLRNNLQTAVRLVRGTASATAIDIWRAVLGPQGVEAVAGCGNELHLQGLEAVNRLVQDRLAELMEVRRSSQGGRNKRRKPRWDAESGELRVGDEIIRRVIPRAKSVRQVLDAFERQGWPRRVDAPFESSARTAAQARYSGLWLHDTIKSLNNGIMLIRFRSDGRGAGVCWDWLPTP